MNKAPAAENKPAAPLATDDGAFGASEYLRTARARRAHEKFLAIKGTIRLKLDIDDLRGRNRR